MRPLYLAGTAAAAVTILAPALSYADCREELAAFNARIDNVGTQDGPTLTAEEREEISGMRSSAETFASSGDEQTCQRIVSRANIMLSAALDPQVIQPEDLEGMDVRGRDDVDLGEVEEVRVDPRTGRLAYLMVEYGGFAGVGQELAAVPWALVRITPENDFVNVDVTEQQIENAPRWSEDIAAETTPRDWAMSVHSFYGVAPYWRSPDAGGRSSADAAASGGQSSGQATSDTASSGQSGEESSSAGAGAGAAMQMSDEGAQEIADGIDRLVEEISALRAVLSQDQQQPSSGQAGSGGNGAGQSSGASSGEQPAEDDASADQASGGSQGAQSESQSGETQSGGAGSGSSASGSNQSSGQSETSGGSTSKDDN